MQTYTFTTMKIQAKQTKVSVPILRLEIKTRIFIWVLRTNYLQKPPKYCDELQREYHFCAFTAYSETEAITNPDDLLPPIEKLEKYADSENIFNR